MYLPLLIAQLNAQNITLILLIHLITSWETQYHQPRCIKHLEVVSSTILTGQPVYMCVLILNL